MLEVIKLVPGGKVTFHHFRLGATNVSLEKLPSPIYVFGVLPCAFEEGRSWGMAWCCVYGRELGDTHCKEDEPLEARGNSFL